MTRDALHLLLLVIALGLGFAVALLRLRRARTRARAALAALLGLAFAVLAWGRLVEPRWVMVTRVEIPWSGPPLRLVVMGDFHVGRTGPEVVDRAVRLANEAAPDVVLLTGDYVTGYDLNPTKARILESLRPLRAKRGVFAVLGNHDSEPYAVETPRAAEIGGFLTGLGFTVLRNRAVDVAGVTLVGLDEVQSGNIDPARAFAGAPDGPRVVMTHDWHGLARAGVGRFDLAVTGHTHGGQICVPFTGLCPLAPDAVPYRAGLYAWPSGGRLFVTRGVGTSAVLMRLGAPPEVAVIDLKP